MALFMGDGYHHGRSTLLRTVESEVYNHIPGDRRLLIVTNPKGFKISPKNKRSIVGVNISPFIN
jgi:predicted ABC-class ATPase